MVGKFIMSKRARLTDKLIDKVWTLYNSNYDYVTIATKLDISQTSVLRCVTAMSIASSGTFVEYTGLLRDSHYIADYANKKFNLTKDTVLNSKSKIQDLETAIVLLAESINREANLLDKLIKKFEN